MQITEQEMEIYRRSARERARKRQVELDERRQRAWEVARLAADLLKNEFGAPRVVLFGSLLRPQLFHARSDVDLAAGEWNGIFGPSRA